MGDELRVDPDEVQAVAREARTIGDQVAEAEPDKRVQVNDALFGGLEAAQDFVSVHGSAQSVLSKTLKAVRQDLEDFATGLENSVASLQRSEDDIERLMRRMGEFALLSEGVNVGLNEDALSGIGESGGMSAEEVRAQAIAEAQETGAGA